MLMKHLIYTVLPFLFCKLSFGRLISSQGTLWSDNRKKEEHLCQTTHRVDKLPKFKVVTLIGPGNVVLNDPKTER